MKPSTNNLIGALIMFKNESIKLNFAEYENNRFKEYYDIKRKYMP